MRTQREVVNEHLPCLLAHTPNSPLRARGCALKQALFIDNTRAVMDAVIDRQAIAKLSKNRAWRSCRNLAKAINHQSLENNLEHPDFLFKVVCIERQFAQPHQVGVW